MSNSFGTVIVLMALAGSCAADWEQQVQQLARQLAAHAAREAPALAIDTRLRAAELLRESQAKRARQFGNESLTAVL